MNAFTSKLSDRLQQELFDYWNRKRVDRAAPSRTDIDPVEMRGMLPYVGLTEVCEGGRRFRYRLVGTAMNRTFGRDYTGSYLDESKQGEYRDYLADLYRRCVHRVAAVYAESEFGYGDDRSLRIKRLLLPLSTDGWNVNMILFMDRFEPNNLHDCLAPYPAELIVGIRGSFTVELQAA